ncbi:MAG: hypothetical protein WCL50_11490 [Spirochaetota bacterium]
MAMTARSRHAILTMVAILGTGLAAEGMAPADAMPAVLSVGAERRICVLDFTNYSEEGGAAYATAIADSLAIELERAGYLVVPTVESRAALGAVVGPQTQASVFALASGLGADVAVTGAYRVEGDLIFVLATAWDLFSSRPAVSLLERGEAGPAVFDTIDGVSGAVAGRARSSLRSLTPAELVIRNERVKLVTRVVEKHVELGVPIDVTLRSPDEGAEVWLGDRLAGKIEKGLLVVSAKVGAPLAVRILGKDLRESEQNFIVDGSKPVHDLQACYRATKFEVGLAYNSLFPQGISLSYRNHYLSDVLFADLEIGAATGMTIRSIVSYLPSGGYKTADTPGASAFSQIISLVWRPFQAPTQLLKIEILASLGNALFIGEGAFGDGPFLAAGVGAELDFPRWTLGLSAKAGGVIGPFGATTFVPEAGKASSGIIDIGAGARWKF